ncbi:helix-turn-helix transcriptional regulator [Massilia forsythiae]|uniref:Helix-turn-helix transcriptional regulator n=1 Tax=Massilia forsythiae TaxID=2728020 RepID=A0A7Z2VYP9_9BURK|nr:helix-turn-helix transcriptional regulator [Massilia forsythiae]QJE01515.1 helix-turn-helix transcriptional regulator [Massilia forsythiae]
MTYPLKTLQQLRPILVGFRKDAGLSQAAVAALLGITQQSYAKIEVNPSTTSVERLFTILRLLGAEIILDRHAVPTSAGQSNGIGLQDTVSPSPPVPVEKPASAKPRKMLPPNMKKENW